MTTKHTMPSNVGRVIARLRTELNAKQGQVAQKAGLDQSRISRVEKGDMLNEGDVTRIVDALAALGSENASRYQKFLRKNWYYLDPPEFWNPQAEYLEQAEETLCQIDYFLSETEAPWPLRRQVERQKNLLENAAGYLFNTAHQIAFVGDIGVGKSTALSFLYDLLIPESSSRKLSDQVMLEAGGGGTTICEVHVRRGPEYGITIQPMPESELRQLVADLCFAKWMRSDKANAEREEAIGVGREIERALRNMSGLTTRRERRSDSTINRRDLFQELLQTCSTEEELRARVLDEMQLHNRTRREVWYDSGSSKSAMSWLADTFKAINNGRMKDMSLPQSIVVMVPDFAADHSDLDVSIIDTKGVDDLAIREDLDTRIRDPRTAMVLCTRFNEAPSTTVKMLLDHVRTTYGERVDTGKLSVLALPRAGEAMEMKDDSGEYPLDEQEGYDLKKEQIERKLAGSDEQTSSLPIYFFNVESDNPDVVRSHIFDQLQRMRQTCAEQVLELCASIDDLIQNHEAQAVNAAVEEVALQLRNFLKSNRELKPREKHAYTEVLRAVSNAHHPSTLWASARRNGQYAGLSIGHQIGVGAAQDAMLRSQDWFSGMTMQLRSMKDNPDLALAKRTIEQIEQSVQNSKSAFAEAVQTAGVEVYREPLRKANDLWTNCADEWGRGPGFKERVKGHLERWFEERSDLKDHLEAITLRLWEQKVIEPILRLTDESADTSNNSSEAARDVANQMQDGAARANG